MPTVRCSLRPVRCAAAAWWMVVSLAFEAAACVHLQRDGDGPQHSSSVYHVAAWLDQKAAKSLHAAQPSIPKCSTTTGNHLQVALLGCLTPRDS